MPKLLIVEDDTLISSLYADKFKREGFQVEEAVDGNEGLTKAKTAQPNLILLDILLPGMDGFEVLKKLKEDPQTAKIPVVFLTNLSRSEADVQKGLELGAVAYLIKAHYKPSEIVAKIKEFLMAYTPTEEEKPKEEEKPPTPREVKVPK